MSEALRTHMIKNPDTSCRNNASSEGGESNGASRASTLFKIPPDSMPTRTGCISPMTLVAPTGKAELGARFAKHEHLVISPIFRLGILTIANSVYLKVIGIQCDGKR